MPKILICEDEHIVALDIKRHLERFGYEVVGTYASGEAAIEACAKARPDLVLMDIHLQGSMDGVAAARLVFEDYRVPVILLTAYADEETVARAKDSLPFGYIIKPFEERELRTAIELALYRHAMDTKLKTSEERYRGLFEEAPSSNFTASTDGIISDCNASFARLLGWPDALSARGSLITERFANGSEGSRFLMRAGEGKPSSAEEWILVRRDGHQVHALATTTVVLDSLGKPSELRGYLVDVTERHELEAQLRQAQKMEAIGRLAGGVAHDFNNILTAIMGFCNLLAEDAGDDPTVREEIDGIQTASRKAVNLTRQLLAFSRKQPIEPKIIDANSVLADTEKMARRLVSENILLKIFADAKRPFVSIDPGQFEQIIVNLIVNAKDAVGEAGSVVVETCNVMSDGSGKNHGIGPGEWFVLTVKDSGGGIASEDLQRIFEPFFTTKTADRGTGLGLSTVYAIVTRNSGLVAVESETGKGSCFYVYLPVVGDKGEAIVPPAPAAGRPKRAGDDDSLRGLLARILSKTGYRVLEASNAGEAILIAEREPEYLLLTDIIMPRMNGFELADRLSSVNKALRVLFISGYHDYKEGKPNPVLAKSAFLQKPFTHDQLMTALDELTK